MQMSVLSGQAETRHWGEPQEELFSPTAEEGGGKQQGELPCGAGEMSGALKDAEELVQQRDSTCKGLESEENVNAGWLTLREVVNG